MSEDKAETAYIDMPGDPVYEYLKTQVLAGGELIGARIDEPTIHMAGSPRKIIHIAIHDHEEDVIANYTFNYNKLLRQIIKENNNESASR